MATYRIKATDPINRQSQMAVELVADSPFTAMSAFRAKYLGAGFVSICEVKRATIRTEWIVDNEQIAAAVKRETGRRVVDVWRGSGLYADVRYADGSEQRFFDGRLFVVERPIDWESLLSASK